MPVLLFCLPVSPFIALTFPLFFASFRFVHLLLVPVYHYLSFPPVAAYPGVRSFALSSPGVHKNENGSYSAPNDQVDLCRKRQKFSFFRRKLYASSVRRRRARSPSSFGTIFLQYTMVNTAFSRSDRTRIARALITHPLRSTYLAVQLLVTLKSLFLIDADSFAYEFLIDVVDLSVSFGRETIATRKI